MNFTKGYVHLLNDPMMPFSRDFLGDIFGTLSMKVSGQQAAGHK
jgi:hypothetical protein